MIHASRGLPAPSDEVDGSVRVRYHEIDDAPETGVNLDFAREACQGSPL